MKQDFKLDEILNASNLNIIKDKVGNVKSDRKKWRETWLIECKIRRKKVIVRLALPEKFPIELPYYFLENPLDLPFMPHIEKEDQLICYASLDSIIVDYNYPDKIISETLKLAIDTIEKGMDLERVEEFKVEFEVNWGRLDNVVKVESFIDDNITSVKELLILKSNREKNFILMENSKDDLQGISKIYDLNTSNVENYKCLLLPIKKTHKIEFPFRFNMWNFKKLKRIILRNITASNKNKLYNIRLNNEKFFLLLRLPYKEDAIVVGIFISPNFKKTNDINFNDLLNSSGILPASYVRMNSNFLHKRTQGHDNYSKYHVLLLGVGSIGSNTLVNLAKMGVSNITIVDKDILLPENSMRHYLGLNEIMKKNTNTFKTHSMKEYLQKNYPNIKIQAVPKDVLDFIKDDFISNYKIYDLVVSALGAPTSELYLNEKAVAEKLHMPIVYAWLDPMGIGGHILITNTKTKKGCFRCLFTENEYPKNLIGNRASFVKSEDNYERKLLGCDSQFTPYSYLDAQFISLKLTKIILDLLEGKQGGNKLISFLGEDNSIRELGFEPSKRYRKIKEQDKDVVTSDIYQSKCIVCGEKNDICK